MNFLLEKRMSNIALLRSWHLNWQWISISFSFIDYSLLLSLKRTLRVYWETKYNTTNSKRILKDKKHNMEDKTLASLVNSVAVIYFENWKQKRKRKPKKLDYSLKKGKIAATQGIKTLSSRETLRNFSVRDYLRNIDVIKQKFTVNVEVDFIYLFLKNDLGFIKQNCQMINGYSSRSQLVQIALQWLKN